MTISSGDTGRVAWITGASRGMGADTALRLAEFGFDVAITARDQGRLEGVATEVENMGRRAFPLASDLTDRASISAFADAAEKWGGRCDAVCNIGVYQGPGARQLVMDMPIEELELTLEADVVAPALLCQRAIPSMVAGGAGFIVNMSSAVVFLDPRGTIKDEGGWALSYAAGKAGIDQLAKLINVELGPAGVRAYTVEPGFVAYGDNYRDLVREGRRASVCPAECIGPAIAWLSSSPDAGRLLAKRVHLPSITEKHGLLAGWEGPGSPYPTRW
jgi:NAD(P)-dependent dehydrogenase (short-subunit alcohol dehydrogenase family)